MIRRFNRYELKYIIHVDKAKRIMADLVEFLIKKGVEGKDFLQDEASMIALKADLEANGYDAGELIWNEDAGIYEITVAPPEIDTPENVFGSSTEKALMPLKIGVLLWVLI